MPADAGPLLGGEPVPEPTPGLVEETASRLADGYLDTGPGDGWQHLTEAERARFRRSALAVLVWLRHRPGPH
jgi:hypothetical protein